MKKLLFAIALGAIIVAGCKKEQEASQQPVLQTVTLRASGEAFDGVNLDGTTKGTMDTDGTFRWAAGDMIGVRLYKGEAYVGNDSGSGYNAWDGGFLLEDAYAGNPSGVFTCTTSLDQYVHWGYAAFYPKFDNNIKNGDGKVYFELKKTYDNYTSGSCLMPMVANLNDPDNGGLNGRPSEMKLKHVGAGVRVTLKDVPAEANQASLTVTGKNIVNGTDNTAWYGVNPANAGTDFISATDGKENTVYLKFATASEKRDITFIFPLPTVDLSGGIELKLYYNNGTDEHKEFWSRKASTLPALARGQLLDMPDLTVPVDPNGTVTLFFRAATPVTTKACLCSSVLGTADWPGTELTETETIAGSLWYKFTVTASQIWDKSINFYFHGGGWATAETYGDFQKHKMEYFFVAEKDKVAKQLASRPADWSFVSSYNVDWDKVTDAAAGRTSANYDAITILKATGNESRVFLYFVLKKASLYSAPTYSYANLLKIYLGDSNSTTAFDWQWTSKYTTKFNSWLQKDGSPAFTTFECDGLLSHVDMHDDLYVDGDVTMIYYELSIPRSFNVCLQGTSATIAIEANKQYVVGSDWQGESTQIGFAPNNWGPTLSFSLPSYTAN